MNFGLNLYIHFIKIINIKLEPKRIDIWLCGWTNHITNFKVVVKKAEQNKPDIRLVSRIIDIMKIIKTDTNQQLSGTISVYKYTQHHYSQGGLFSSEKTCDVEC